MGCIADHQHRGKPSRPSDRGAAHDLDGNEKVESHETEAHLVEGYIAVLSQFLAVRGEPFALIANGSYESRHARAAALADLVPEDRWAYLACHINASDPPGGYGAVFYDARSEGSRELAECIAEELTVECPELQKVVVSPCAKRGSPRDGQHWYRAFSTLRGIWEGPSNLSGVCLEPGFINNPDHAELFTHDGLARIGRACARGVIRWTRGETDATTTDSEPEMGPG